jgi:P4 family phage/plasmid primase-like protien
MSVTDDNTKSPLDNAIDDGPPFDDIPPLTDADIPPSIDDDEIPLPDEPSDGGSEEPKKSKKRKAKSLGLALSDSAPDELFDAYVLDADTGMERETSLKELLTGMLRAPAMTVEATEKLVGGAVAAILDGRLRRDRSGIWWAATPTGWEEIDKSTVAGHIKSLIGRPDVSDKATRALIPYTWRKPTKADMQFMTDESQLDAPIPEPADKWSESTDIARHIREDIEGRSSVFLADGFDAKSLLLNAGGLVIDIGPNIVNEIDARPLSRHDLISRSTRPRFDPDATCPLWEKFVAEIMSVADGDGVITRRRDMERFLQVTAGLTLIGEVVEQVVLIYHGQLGSNGKSVYANALSYVFGTYSAVLPKAVLMEKRAETHTTDLTVLEGARFAYAKETKRTRWDAELLKDLASREAYAARKLYENNREITPSHTLHASTNNLPLLPSGDAAVWRRVKIVEFLMRWYADGDRDEDKAVSVGPVDLDLPAKLEAEAAGILNWILDGLRMYYADGKLVVPDDVRRSTEAARRTASLWAEFLVEHFELTDDDNDTVALKDIWKLWGAYKAENSQHSQLAPTGSKDVKAAFEAEMPGAKAAGGRVPGKRNTAEHFARVKLTEVGLDLKAALVGTATPSKDGVVVPFTPHAAAADNGKPFGESGKGRVK